MKKYIVVGAFAVFGSLLFAPQALATTDDIASWGDDNLGGSIGTTGGSVALGGVRTSVDGFGTLQGSTVITQGKNELFSIRQSYDNGFDSTTSFNNGSVTQGTELYYNGEFESSWNTPNGSIELVCAPTTGCHTE